MKILQVSSVFFPFIGGMERVIYDISKRLVERGHEVTVLTTDMYLEEPAPHEEMMDGFKVVRLKNDLFLKGYGFSLQFMDYLNKHLNEYDLVHIHGYGRFVSDYSLLVCHGKKPTIFAAQGFMHSRKDAGLKAIFNHTLGKLVRFADVCAALTKLDIEKYRKLGVEKRRIKVIPAGIDTKQYRNKSGVSAFKRRYGLRGNVLLFVGRIHESKGLQYAIESIKDIDCKLVIVGKDAGYQKALEDLSVKLGVREKVVFTGPVSEEEKIAAYNSCDIFILISEWEGFGIVLVEAMAAGKPIIGSNRGAIPEVVDNGKNGIITMFGDSEMIEKAIVKLLHNKKLSKEMGEWGRKFSKDYDWNSIIDKLEMIYRRCANTYL